MLRRTLLVSLSAVTLAGCGGSRAGPSAAPESVVGVEVLLIDAQTPFANTGQPYLAALRDARPGDDAGIVWQVREDYGRTDGATVRAPVVAAAEDRERLAEYFAALPREWSLPPSHGIRFQSDDSAGSPRWAALVVRLPPILTDANIVSVDADESAAWLRLDAGGTSALDRASAANVGQKVAIAIDGVVVADPVINSRISGGQVQVSLDGGASAHRALAERFTT